MTIQNLELTDTELNRLIARVEQDYEGARSQNEARTRRFAGYYALYRGLLQDIEDGRIEVNAQNYQVLLILWSVQVALADLVEKLFGDDAEITARPVEPTDTKRVKIVSLWMNWLVYQQMRMILPAIRALFDAVLYGRSHIFMPWDVDSYWARDPGTGDLAKRVWSKGPKFCPLDSDEIVVPAEKNAKSIHDFSFIIRRFWTTPQQLLDDERDGVYYGIRDNFQNILHAAREQPTASRSGREENELADVQELSQGLNYAGSGSETGAEVIECWEWYGYYRPEAEAQPAMEDAEEELSESGLEVGPGARILMPEEADSDTIEDNGTRDKEQIELRFTYIPHIRLPIGVHNLMDLYPDRRHRRPFEELSIAVDSYWPMGLGEKLAATQDKLTKNHNLASEAIAMQTIPPLLEEAGAGVPERLTIHPGARIKVKDVNRVKQLDYRANFEGNLALEQMIMAYYERITGQSDQALGRQSDRPNAPRTLGQQQLIAMGGDKRMNLDVTILREHFAVVLSRIWELCCQFADEEMFMRVTGEEADGLLDVNDDFANIPREEFTGRFDFDIRFATSYWNREANKARFIEVYPLLVQNPVVAMNPQALWNLANKLWEKCGFDNFAEIVPPPGPVDMPIDPKREFTILQEGGKITVHPLDNDEAHLEGHRERLPKIPPDSPAFAQMLEHIDLHEKQAALKLMQQQTAQALAQTVVAAAVQQQQQGGESGGGQAKQ